MSAGSSTAETLMGKLEELLPGVTISGVGIDREAVEKGESCVAVTGVFNGRGVRATFRKSNHMDPEHVAKVLATHVRRSLA